MNQLFLFSGIMGVFIFENTVAQSLSQAECARIERHGELYVRALNSGSAESHAKNLDAIYAARTLEKVSNARIQKQMKRLHNDLGALEYHHSEIAEFNLGDAIKPA